LVFLVIPALLWTALSFGQRGTTGVAFIIAIVATAATLRGRGPFALADRELSLLLLENFVAVITVMSLILAADVRQRQSIEGQLRASEQRYRDLFERNPQPVWVCDYETLRFLAVNEAAVQHYGYSRPEFLRMTLADLMPAGTGDGVADALARASRGEELHQEWQHRTKEGALIQVEITARNLIFDQRPAAVMLSNDITERKRAERQTTAFSELGRRLSAARSPREAAQIVMGTADALFGWEACLFELYSKEQNDLTPVLCIDTINGKRTDVTSDCDHPGPGAHAREALQQGARLVLRQDPPTFGPDMHPFGDKSRPSASLMFAPVRKEREAIAVLSIQSYIPNRYNEADLRLFQSLADHCASALERIAAEEELLHLNSELENRVRQRTAQLEAINKELEAFSYSVSHDLRAPLRSIRGFSDVLLERYAAKLDSRGQEFLRRACESSHQMDRLIEDLLKLSRVGRSELQHQDVNLSALAESVVVELRQSEPKRKARFVIAPGLQAQGDERLLRIVLENLLRNAWKFTSKLSESLIEVGFVSPQEAFFVRDNGAGFDMAYASKLFGVFQRLHSTTDFPGTGVGLATVQRIINRHGGRVWVEAAVDKGATFYFTLGQEDRL
jgi:PAS domain S-box-containing protein